MPIVDLKKEKKREKKKEKKKWIPPLGNRLHDSQQSKCSKLVKKSSELSQNVPICPKMSHSDTVGRTDLFQPAVMLSQIWRRQDSFAEHSKNAERVTPG